MSLSIRSKAPAAVARDRLATLITKDRAALAGPDPLDRLQEEILNAVKRNLRGGRVNVRQGIGRQVKVLEIDIDLQPQMRS